MSNTQNTAGNGGNAKYAPVREIDGVKFFGLKESPNHGFFIPRGHDCMECVKHTDLASCPSVQRYNAMLAYNVGLPVVGIDATKIFESIPDPATSATA